MAEPRFGPQGRFVIVLIERTATLTAEDMRRLAATWQKGRLRREASAVPEFDVAGSAYAAWAAVWDLAARPAAAELDRTVVAAALECAAAAAYALAQRHLVGTAALSQQHYEQLTAAWCSVFGPVHPADHAATSIAS